MVKINKLLLIIVIFAYKLKFSAPEHFLLIWYFRIVFILREREGSQAGGEEQRERSGTDTLPTSEPALHGAQKQDPGVMT